MARLAWALYSAKHQTRVSTTVKISKTGLFARPGPPFTEGVDRMGHLAGPACPGTDSAGAVDQPAVVTGKDNPAASLLERIGGPASGQRMSSTGSFQTMQRSCAGE
jgi:hypothetical protein